MSGKCIEITVCLLHINAAMYDALRSIYQNWNRFRMSDIDDFPDWIYQSENIGNLRYSDEFSSVLK